MIPAHHGPWTHGPSMPVVDEEPRGRKEGKEEKGRKSVSRGRSKWIPAGRSGSQWLMDGE